MSIFGVILVRIFPHLKISIVSVKVIKIVDEKETKKTTKTNKQKGARGREAVVKRWELNDFALHFIYFFSSLELTLSIILKQRESYESKNVAVECRCLKI